MARATVALKIAALTGCLALQSAWQVAPEPEASSEAASDNAPAQSAKAAEVARWACYIRPSVYKNVVARCGVEMHPECSDGAFARYHLNAEALAHNEAVKSASFRERLEAEYRAYLDGRPEDDPEMDSRDRARIANARERISAGGQAVDFMDPFCMRSINRRLQETRQELYLGEMALRTALVNELAGCAIAPLSPSEVERLQNRIALEASDRGVEDRRFFSDFDPGLIVSFDLYGEIQSAMKDGGPLKRLTSDVFSVRDSKAESAPQVVSSVRIALLSFDSDSAAALRAWVFKLTERSATKELNVTTAEQELRSCDQLIGGLIRRRWTTVCDVADALRQDGDSREAERWLDQAGRAMFPSVYTRSRSEDWVAEVQAAGTVTPEALSRCQERYLAFGKEAANVRSQLIAELVAGAGYYGRRSQASTEQVGVLRAKLAALDTACVEEMKAMAGS